MALPQDGQNANALATVKEVPIGKKLIFVDPDTNEGGIITIEDLTTQILKKLTSQTFALDQGTKTLPAALNELNSKASKVFLAHVETGTYNKFKIIAKAFTPIFMVGVSGGNNHYAGTIFIGDSGYYSTTIIGSNVEVTYVSNGAVIVSCEMYANLIVLSGSPCTIEKVN